MSNDGQNDNQHQSNIDGAQYIEPIVFKIR